MSEIRAIDADKLMAMFRYPIDYSAVYVRKMIDAAPTIDTVRHARWTMDGRCTACDGFEPCDDEGSRCSSDFCPDCGARMDGEEKDG